MGHHRFVPAAAAVLAVVLASAASAAPAERPVEKRGINGSTTIKTPAGGAATVTSGKVPKNLDQVDMVLGEEAGDSELFKVMTFSMINLKPKGRTLSCIMLAAVTLDRAIEQLEARRPLPDDVEGVARTKSLAVAAMCMRVARLLTEIQAEPPPTRAARSTCDVEPVKLKFRTERTEDGGFRLVPTGGVGNGAKTAQARVSCKGKGATMKLRMKAKKNTSLDKAFGSNIQLGVVSPSDAERDAEVKVSFKGR